jgi:hypothetical protein
MLLSLPFSAASSESPLRKKLPSNQGKSIKQDGFGPEATQQFHVGRTLAVRAEASRASYLSMNDQTSNRTDFAIEGTAKI